MIKSCLTFFGLFLLIWCVLFICYKILPEIRPGVDQVNKAKVDILRSEELFKSESKVRVAVFGDSKVLAGVNPNVFSRLSSDSVCCWNLGIGGGQFDLPDMIRLLCGKRNKPTHIFLTLPWTEPQRQSFSPFKIIRDDKRIIEILFPFRKFPRDIALFLMSSRSIGGFAASLEKARLHVSTMSREQGYFFIEGQSHYPGHRLPDDFRLESDKPESVAVRGFDMSGQALALMDELAQSCAVRFYIVPIYKREGEASAPPAVNERTMALTGRYDRIRLLGPDYWLLPPRYFSDPAHLNRQGADLYSSRLFELLTQVLAETAER